MILQLSYYSVTLFAATAILGILAWYIWKRRSVPGGTYFALLMAVTAEWVLVSALGYASVDAATMMIFAKLAFAGGVIIPQLWLLFVLQYCRLDRLITPGRKLLLWVVPVISIALTMTNEYHGLIWSSVEAIHFGLGEIMLYNRGIAAQIVTVYSYALVIPGYLLLLWHSLRSGEKNLPRAASLLLGAMIVIFLSGISQYGLIPRQGIDLTPLALTIMGLIFAWGVFRRHIFELLPVATEKLIENMADGVVVLNRQGTVVKINIAAGKKLGLGDAAVGQPAEKMLAEWPLLAECIRNKSGSCEITTGDGNSGNDRQKWIDARVSHLLDKHDGPLGTLIILRDITVRKLAEESLRKSEYDRIKAEQLANIGYFEWDLESFSAHVSEGCARIFGFPPGTDIVSYTEFVEKIHPEDAPRMHQAVQALVERGEAVSIEYRIILPDGSVRYIHSESEMMKGNTSDARVRMFGIVHDITERKLYEESLRKSEKDRLKAEQLAHLGYYDWDLKKLEAQISEGSARIFGFPAQTITYEMFTGRIHPEDRKRTLEEIHSSVEQGLAHLLEFRIVRPDGSVRHVRSESEAAVRDTAGTPVRQFGIVQDITERKLAEEALHLSEARYKTMVETASEGIVILDREDRLAFINKKVSDLTGFTQGEVYGHSAYDFIGSENHDSLRKNLAAKRLGISEQYDYRINCKNGGSVWVIASASPLYDEKGEFMATLAMLTDITDRKRADEQLKISLKEKEALLKEVHHRVKNNLQIITSLLNLQSSGIDDPKYTDMIRDSQNRIKSMALVHEHLYKSRDLSNIDIAEYLTSLISNISRSFSHVSGSVTLRTDIEKINVDIDRAVPLGIIVTELVSNAYKYAFPGGRAGEIRVDLKREAGKIVLTVSDNGVGLPEGFEIGKTGTLGLQLVEMLTQQIDGTLEAESKERTIFRINIQS